MVQTLTTLWHKKQSEESTFPLEATPKTAPQSAPASPPSADTLERKTETVDPPAPADSADSFEIPDATRPERPSRRNRKGEKAASQSVESPAPASSDTEAATDSNPAPNSTLTPIEA